MLIGITGRMSSGKSTVADHLVNKHGFSKMGFADSLKDLLASVFSWDRTLLEGETEESRKWRETVDEWWAKRLGDPSLTPRKMLQQWGTEVCRQNFNQDIWIASLEIKLIKALSEGKKIVISDCRFHNEITLIKKIGGRVFRIEREDEPEWYPYARLYNYGDQKAHAKLKELGIHSSEYSSVGLDYDENILNKGSIEELYGKVDSVL
jgi:hypothetical protein